MVVTEQGNAVGYKTFLIATVHLMEVLIRAATNS